MTDSKKKRMSMLDSLAAAGMGAGAPTGSPNAAGSMMSTNRALRSARDAVDSHRIWELDPEQITDDRPRDRLDASDVEDLRRSIEVNGQSVPILVRRDPSAADRYLLVYGGRRLAAIRSSNSVTKVRALIASLDDDSALRTQISENTGRRDLSFIERALFATQLLDQGFGTQVQIAEVLNISKSAVSMAISVARAVGPELAQAIGPAHGIGRPRWEALVADLAATKPDLSGLIERAQATREAAVLEEIAAAQSPDAAPAPDASVVTFDGVARELHRLLPKPPKTGEAARTLHLNGARAGQVKRTKTGVRLDLNPADSDFADWLDAQAQDVLQDLYARWKQQG
ncbi:plasmid partitioning protein RepB [Pararhodobacter sp. CCB-MM2]|uniref:plasmid partitioning protein RepB n=1 Tax=Pararhodobacter sp. CCB-MM2 TaxID=1786003 RepID=UPI00083665B3|nr:plasmid partitioning protein RepB [Pararhodobacter sp. CCB-MM2]MCA2012106.1 plasmid partitioning protein RepB [Cereibacter sphaeroides]